MINKPRRPNTPRAAEIEAGLALLTALGGGDKKAWQYLTDLVAATDHNERLLADLHEKAKALDDLERRERELAVVETRCDKKLAELAAIRENWQAYERDLKAGTL